MKALSLVLVLGVVGWVSCVCKHKSESPFRAIEGCPINRMYRPVCGTDGCNYINDNALVCAQKDDRARLIAEEDVVKMAYSGECQEDEGAAQAAENNNTV